MLGEIRLDDTAARLAADGYCILSAPPLAALAEAARAAYFAGFRDVPLRATGFAPAELEQGPIRKKNISSSNGLGEAYAQALQSTYYPRRPPGALSDAFSLIIAIRNRLTRRPEDYGDDPVRDGFWNARRIHHYPRGGGFMVPHTDTYFSKALGDDGFLQVIYLLSRKGQDFERGGGVIWDRAGNAVDLEEVGGFGSIVVFDGRTRHGVRDVDPQEPFSFEARSGRLSAIANLYEHRPG